MRNPRSVRRAAGPDVSRLRPRRVRSSATPALSEATPPKSRLRRPAIRSIRPRPRAATRHSGAKPPAASSDPAKSCRRSTRAARCPTTTVNNSSWQTLFMRTKRSGRLRIENKRESTSRKREVLSRIAETAIARPSRNDTPDRRMSDRRDLPTIRAGTAAGRSRAGRGSSTRPCPA